MRWPWSKRLDAAKAETVKAANEYEWAVQQRTTVSTLVRKLIVIGERNNIVENLNTVIRGGHR